MQDKYGFIYIWFDKKHRRFYIGMHWGTEEDGYICSSSWMKQAYKHRPNDFKRRILEYVHTNRKDLYEREKYWLSFIKDNELKIKYYNISKNINDTWLSDKNIKSRKEKISLRTKEAMCRPEVREKYIEGMKKRNNRSSDIETKEKRRKTMINTMLKKFPIENRKIRLRRDSEELLKIYSNKTSELWKNRTEEEKMFINKKNSEGQKKYHQLNPNARKGMLWWNNGTINTRSKNCPGESWVRGKI